MDTNLCPAQKSGSMGNGVYVFQNVGHVLQSVLHQYSVHPVHLSINSGSTLCVYYYNNTLLRMTHAF